MNIEPVFIDYMTRATGMRVVEIEQLEQKQLHHIAKELIRLAKVQKMEERLSKHGWSRP
jgi:Holliday junction resolvasome RuvABC endonuclease subunit